jgi:hypothetical protein
MKCIALERELPEATPEDFAKYADQEARKVWELIQQDIIREIYFRADRDSAVIVLESRDVTDAGEVLALLPYVTQGLIEFEIIPLKAYPGLGRLFD